MTTRTALRELRHRRWTAHGIGRVSTPAAAVTRLLAVQAQDFAAARWAIGLRSGADDAAVTAAFTDGELVRAWTMRGTLFAVPAVDLSWMLSLTAPRMLAQAATRRAQLGLDDTVIERARTVMLETLSGGGEASREQVMTLLAENGIDPSGQRGYHVIAHLAQTGTWCWGPVRDGVNLLVLHAEWIPSPRLLERDEALGEFAYRYFAGHGPASVRDFAWWTKLTLADARAGLAVAGDRLAEFGAGSGLWFAADDAAMAYSDAERRAFAAEVAALPGFDEYYLGYGDRAAIIEPEQESVVVPGGNGVFQPTIVAAGQVVGTWRRTSRRGGVEVTPVPFDAITAAQRRGFDRAALRYAGFLGLPLLNGRD